MAKVKTETTAAEAPTAVPEAPSASFLGSIISTQEDSKKTFAADKKAEREALYALADDTIDKVIHDGREYTAYLNMQAQLPMGVNNVALLLAQRPTATLLRTYGEWKDRGVSVTDYDNPVRLLMSETYKGTRTMEAPNAYGEVVTQAVSYSGRSSNVVNFYDVLQTNRPIQPERPKLDSQERVQVAIKAMLQAAKVSVAINNDLTQPQYSPVNREIRLTENLTPSETFRQLAVGCAHALISRHSGAYLPEQYTLEAYSVAHVLCKRYGAEHAEMDFSGAPSWFATLNSHGPDQAKESLHLINRVSKELGQAVQRDLSPPTQQRNNPRRNQPTR